MECPECGSNTKVIDSRKVELNVFRKRKCGKCSHIFYTEEVEISLEEADIYMSALKREYRKKKMEKKHEQK